MEYLKLSSSFIDSLFPVPYPLRYCLGASTTMPAELRHLPDLLTVVILAALLFVLMVVVMSMIIAARRLMMTYLKYKPKKTRYVDAWKIAGQRVQPDQPPPADEKQKKT
ncbi:MAG TPA: hypothetical protein VMG59_00450 [Phycisphaerae bacterium]|nr:hypothetical protein [Phycisphaerae bacterium]